MEIFNYRRLNAYYENIYLLRLDIVLEFDMGGSGFVYYV